MDKQRIYLLIKGLEKNLEQIKSYLPSDLEKYKRFTIRKLAIERLLQTSIEVVIDISILLIKEFDLGIPNDDENAFDLLKDKINCIEKLKQMKRFRNILVHKYGTINDEIVYANASENIRDFYEFIEEVKKLINS
jgi:uncharacterized protein YutE (UPF0331/DUF86 family)